MAAGLLAKPVTFWFDSEVAHPYTTLAAGTTGLAFLALALARDLLPGVRGAAAALAWALLAEFRQDLLLLLAALFLAARRGRPLRDWLTGCCAGSIRLLAWLMPTAALSEGFVKQLYMTFRQNWQVSGSSSLFALVWQALQTRALVLATFLWEGLSFAHPGLLVFLLYCGLRPAAGGPALRSLLLWAGPRLLPRRHHRRLQLHLHRAARAHGASYPRSDRGRTRQPVIHETPCCPRQCLGSGSVIPSLPAGSPSP